MLLRPIAAQSGSEVQQTAGFVFVHEAPINPEISATSRHTIIRCSSIMRPLSTATAKGCATGLSR